MQVEVDTHDRSGKRLPQLAQTAPSYATDVFESIDGIASKHVNAIIAANDPRSTAQNAEAPAQASLSPTNHVVRLDRGTPAAGAPTKVQ
jgi:hypothetical protein